MVDIDEFVKEHNSKHRYYCEILILKDGTPVYANPSHQIKLIEVYGVPREQAINHSGDKYIELTNTIPDYAAPTEWLVEKTKAAAIWYNNLMLPLDYTIEQIDTIVKLIKGGCLDRKYKINIAAEYSVCELYKKFEDNLLSKETYYSLKEDIDIQIDKKHQNAYFLIETDLFTESGDPKNAAKREFVRRELMK